MMQKRYLQPVVIAVGGNSIDGLEQPTAQNIVRLAKQGRTLITHGNGPQVGAKLEAAEEAGLTKTIAQCTRETQKEIGQALQQSIHREIHHRNLPIHVFRPSVIETRVVVDPKDPAFQTPSKFIGRNFPLTKFVDQAQQRPDGLFDWTEAGITWQMKEVPGQPGMFRRVVPSPKPVKIHPDDLAEIKKSIFLGKMVIGVGGGGIPIFPDGSEVEAVIDKDLATALLCREIEAQSLIISTGVPYVAHHFKQPYQQDILYYQLRHALSNLKADQYPAGAMGEKIEAAINVLRYGVNNVLISQPKSIWINNEGTTITRGIDLIGRLLNFARKTGLISRDLQRWLVT